LTNKTSDVSNSQLITFLKRKISDKLAQTSKIKSKDQALPFLEDLIIQAHDSLIHSNVNYSRAKKFLKSASTSHLAIKKNGNVALHLTKFVISLE
jgi:hypothetical protein